MPNYVFLVNLVKFSFFLLLFLLLPFLVNKDFQKLVIQEAQVLCCFNTSLVLFFYIRLFCSCRTRLCLKCQYPSLPFSLFTLPHIPVQGACTLWKRARSAAVVEPDGPKANWSAKFYPARGWNTANDASVQGSEKIEVIDFGLKSLGLAGLEILRIITPVFHHRGTFCNRLVKHLSQTQKPCR